MTEKNNNEMVQEQKPTSKKKAPKKLTKAEKRKILKNAEAVVINNDGAFLYYKDEVLGVEIELPEYGDTDIVEIETLRRMNMKSRDFFEKYWMLVTDYYCDDERITLEDVYEYIGINKYYDRDEDEEYILPNDVLFDDLLIGNTNYKEFAKVVKNMNGRLVTQLCNRAVILYKEGRFANSLKMQTIEERIDREGFFLDIKLED